jgi:Leucine-rich repeat (LRR) protein
MNRLSVKLVALAVGASLLLPGAWFLSERANARASSLFSCPEYDPDVPGSMRTSDCQALVQFYNDTGGSNWVNNAGWLTDAPPCTWFGVGCTRWEPRGYIWEISLSENNLVGPISSISGMPYLHYLKLRSDHLTGDITSLCSHEFYWIGLDDNELSGAIPSCLGGQTQLWSLLLRGNAFTGSIPAQLGNMTSMATLWLDHNQLTGEIPPTLGNLALAVQLFLSGNQLSGPIPKEIGNLANVQQLELEDNRLTGGIPPELGGLTQVRSLLMARNQLTGTIPSELGDLKNLTGLALYHNQLSGSIPTELGNLTSLEGLNLGNNQLSGSIPAELGKLTNLEQLMLGYNKLSGTLPSQFGNLSSLRQLDLQNNSDLHGQLPFSLLNLTLSYLDIRGTQLCVPGVPLFDQWLAAIADYRGSGQECCQYAVPRLGQRDGDWADDIYDLQGPRTIGDIGCRLTALTMALNNAGLTETPGTLNVKMNDKVKCPGCYDGSGNVGDVETVKNITNGALRFFDGGYRKSKSFEHLDRLLCKGPVIVGVKFETRDGKYGAGHYVLVTGHQDGKYTIVDPGYSAKTTLADWGNEFSIRGVVTSAGTRATSCEGAAVASDAAPSLGEMIIGIDDQSILVTDELGRETGFDAVAGEVKEEIPGSVYYVDALDDDTTGALGEDYSAFVVIWQPAPGSYQINVTGMETGSYTVTYSSFSRDGTLGAPVLLSGFADVGGVYPYTVQYGAPSSVYLPLVTR